MIPFMINDDRISTFIKGKPYLLDKSDSLFEKVADALRSNCSEDEVLDIIKHKEIKEIVKEDKEDKEVIFDGEKVSEALAKRILYLQENNLPLSSIRNFLKNLSKNPSKESAKDLYGFLEACDLPITDDGCFLAYKKVRKDFKDCHTGKFDNSVGKVVKMPREEVNPNRTETCSTGLHVCSKSYLSSFGGDIVIVCKVNPKDVVAVPIDYNNAKMRVCKYLVIGTIDIAEEEIKPMVASKKNSRKKSNRSKKDSIKKASKSLAKINKGEKFDAYVNERNLPDDITSMEKNQKNALRKFSARLLFGKAHAAGKEINSCTTISELRKVVCEN